MLLPGPSEPVTVPGRVTFGQEGWAAPVLCPRTELSPPDPQPMLRAALGAARSSSAHHKPLNCQEQTQRVPQLPQASAPGAPRASPVFLSALRHTHIWAWGAPAACLGCPTAG